jgi:hypothetical protein
MRATRVHQLDPLFQTPRQEMPRRKLWSVVTANRHRHPRSATIPLQFPRHSPARKTRIHLQGQTFARLHVDHALARQRPNAKLQVGQMPRRKSPYG